jgi:YfiH family protein
MTGTTHWQDHDGLAVLPMAALEAVGGVRALFTGRAGGVSPLWKGGLNWSLLVGDQPTHVHENRRRTLGLFGLTPRQAVMAGLVHGDRVVRVTGEDLAGLEEVAVVPDCDALITDQPDLALVITAADCVPVFLYDPVRRAVGVAHAGWRGTVLGIAGKTAQAMAAAFGSKPSNLLAAVGPSIGPCCYEVDERVALPLRAYYGDDTAGLLAMGRAPGKYQLDLWAANRLDLSRSGIKKITISGTCTSCGVDQLFSHRADDGRAGRGAAIIALQP